MTKFYEDLKEFYEEIIACWKGKISLRNVAMYLPKTPKEYKAEDIQKICCKYNYSQRFLAKALNVVLKPLKFGVKRTNT